MKFIKIGSTGNDVKKWQYFLIGQGIYKGLITGNFDETLNVSTKEFQRISSLNPDGKVGNFTVGAAMLLGFGVVVDVEVDITSDNYPLKPNFEPIASNSDKQNLFGIMKYKSNPLFDKDGKEINPENITITNNWDKTNIIKVKIPQLIPIKGTDTVWFHKKAEKQLVKLWEDWEKNNLIHNILTWEGSYNPRFIRGSKTVLSNHAFGTAFDINYNWNKLGVVPALVGQKGCVRELVEIANKNGFYWGGHFSRRDGMHFEIANI
jgi:D-alanyl-D-alanine carboxypeptidase/Putative peptidoglycan binding domain